MACRLSSNSFEKHLNKVEEEFAPEHIEEVRQGFRDAGMSTNVVRLIDHADSGTAGTEVAGLYEVQSDNVGLASMEVIERISQGGKGSVREQIRATLDHEGRHQHSRKKAQERGELGLIAENMGQESDMLLQELMASEGTERFDAYNSVRSRAMSVVNQTGMTRNQVRKALYDGREAEIVDSWAN
ncbi:hypothetical protein GF354_01455 [Candidatus Peregrinibacteria bacterium]|nr:hypothetical protein [Candidatus Peregrinibacteria bacterium]